MYYCPVATALMSFPKADRFYLNLHHPHGFLLTCFKPEKATQRNRRATFKSLSSW